MSLKKETPLDQQLHVAAQQGNIELLKKSLESGRVHVDCKDKEGTTPLILACANNHIDCVEELLSEGAHPGARRITGTSALFFAAQGGFLEVVKLLLQHNAPTDLPSYDGGTPFLVACQCNHFAIAEELLKHGVDVNAEMVDGATPLFVSAQNGHVGIVRFLVKNGADVHHRRKDGATALWIAAQMGHTSIVVDLLEAGAHADTIREDGVTPLFKASHKGHVNCVQELLKYKPNLGMLQNGESAMHGAALFGQLEVIKQLISAGSQHDLKNKTGETPAQLAREAGYTQIAQYLDKVSLDNTQEDKLSTNNAAKDVPPKPSIKPTVVSDNDKTMKEQCESVNEKPGQVCSETEQGTEEEIDEIKKCNSNVLTSSPK